MRQVIQVKDANDWARWCKAKQANNAATGNLRTKALVFWTPTTGEGCAVEN